MKALVGVEKQINPIIEMRHVSKYYGGFPALLDVDFQIESGIIHAIMGENGAGKSTLMKLLAGVIQPEEGQLLIDGQPVFFPSPRQAEHFGIICMFQELSLAPHLSVGDNIVLSQPDTRFGFIKSSSYNRAREALEKVGAGGLSLNTQIKDLSLSERQLVEIAKAIYRKPRLLILDEATSALTSEMVDLVFEVIRDLRDQGVGILFISHRFHEVDRLAEKMSVFRNGRHIETFSAGTYDHSEIVRLMIGQSLKEMFPPRTEPVAKEAPVVLEIEGLTWENQLQEAGIRVKAGEIVGLGGLDGQGQQAFLLATFGLLKGVTGRIKVNGRQIDRITPNLAKHPNCSLALVPEDRKTEGLILDMSIRDNLNLAVFSQVPWGILGCSGVWEKRIAELIERMGLVYRDLDDPVASLSGGNQQKVVLSKWLALNPRCLLLLDPTRGIDVKAKSQIYQLLRQLATEGMAIVLQSTDHEELINLCDRVYVFYHGRVTRELSSDVITAEMLISASMNLDSSPKEDLL